MAVVCPPVCPWSWCLRLAAACVRGWMPLCVAVVAGVGAPGAWWAWLGAGARVDVYLVWAAGGLRAAGALLPCVWRPVLSGGAWLPTERSANFFVHLPADSARVSRPRMWSFTFGHPEERYCSSDDRDSIREGVPRSGVVRRGGWCDGSCLVVAACPCVWLVTGLCVLVVDEGIVIHTAVMGCL